MGVHEFNYSVNYQNVCSSFPWPGYVSAETQNLKTLTGYIIKIESPITKFKLDENIFMLSRRS
jgi:hypothetical protein